jgi:hypothetical protein
VKSLAFSRESWQEKMIDKEVWHKNANDTADLVYYTTGTFSEHWRKEAGRFIDRMKDADPDVLREVLLASALGDATFRILGHQDLLWDEARAIVDLEILDAAEKEQGL